MKSDTQSRIELKAEEILKINQSSLAVLNIASTSQHLFQSIDPIIEVTYRLMYNQVIMTINIPLVSLQIELKRWAIDCLQVAYILFNLSVTSSVVLRLLPCCDTWHWCRLKVCEFISKQINCFAPCLRSCLLRRRRRRRRLEAATARDWQLDCFFFLKSFIFI